MGTEEAMTGGVTVSEETWTFLHAMRGRCCGWWAGRKQEERIELEDVRRDVVPVPAAEIMEETCWQ